MKRKTRNEVKDIAGCIARDTVYTHENNKHQFQTLQDKAPNEMSFYDPVNVHHFQVPLTEVIRAILEHLNMVPVEHPREFKLEKKK